MIESKKFIVIETKSLFAIEEFKDRNNSIGKYFVSTTCDMFQCNFFASCFGIWNQIKFNVLCDIISKGANWMRKIKSIELVANFEFFSMNFYFSWLSLPCAISILSVCVCVCMCMKILYVLLRVSLLYHNKIWRVSTLTNYKTKKKLFFIFMTLNFLTCEKPDKLWMER